jgi:hypothetical protein
VAKDDHYYIFKVIQTYRENWRVLDCEKDLILALNAAVSNHHLSPIKVNYF